jgi:hypothetical protein
MGGLRWRRGKWACAWAGRAGVGVEAGRWACAGCARLGAGSAEPGGTAARVAGPWRWVGRASLRPPGRGVAIGRCRPLSARPGGGEEDAARESRAQGTPGTLFPRREGRGDPRGGGAGVGESVSGWRPRGSRSSRAARRAPGKPRWGRGAQRAEARGSPGPGRALCVAARGPVAAPFPPGSPGRPLAG